MAGRVGFEPTRHSSRLSDLANRLLQPLEYLPMAGAVGVEPTVAGSKPDALRTVWLRPCFLRLEGD